MYQEISIGGITPEFAEADCKFLKTLAAKKLDILFDNSYIKLECWEDEVLKDLENFLKTKKYEYEIRLKHTIYKEEELQQFDFFYCDGQRMPNTTLEFEYFSFKSAYNNGFDMSGYCLECKRGAVQNGPLTVKGCHINVFGKKKLLTPGWMEWFADNELTEKLIQTEVTGLDILPVYSEKMGELPYIHQLKPSNIVKDIFMPEIYHHEEKCPICENYKNTICFNKPNLNINNIYIREEKKALLKDFNETFERKGTRMGYYIISKKFLNVMLDAGIRQGKDVYFWPVQFK